MSKYNFSTHIRHIVGIDEAGRGPLAGPVAVGVVSVSCKLGKQVERRLFGILDSKKLSQKRREDWVKVAQGLRKEGSIEYAVSLVGVSFIDDYGIVSAVRMGIKRSLLRISSSPKNTHVILDGGLHAPSSYCSQETIVRGDESERLISLASILAKVRRDHYMERLSLRYPEYGFDAHKGYGTAKHMESIKKYGISSVHRKNFIHLF